MATVYFPLLANTIYFGSENLIAQIENRIKVSLLFCDTLYFEDVVATFELSEDAPSSEFSIQKYVDKQTREAFTLPKEAISDWWLGTERTSYKYYQYKTDFYPILLEADLIGDPSIVLREDWPNGRQVRFAPTNAVRKKLEEVYLSNAPPYIKSELLIDSIFEGIYYASQLGASAILHPSFQPLLKAADSESNQSFDSDSGSSIYNAWLSIGLPDYRKFDFSQIMKIRTSSSGIDLRHRYDLFLNEASSLAQSPLDSDTLETLFRKYIVRELLEEVASRKVDFSALTLTIALNSVPFGGFVDVARSIAEGIADRRSWINLLTVND